MHVSLWTANDRDMGVYILSILKKIEIVITEYIYHCCNE